MISWRPEIKQGFEVIPAIDIKGGRCVRLYQGDYDQETVFSENPVEIAAQWVEQGAKRLHLVDLDGAKDGVPKNLGAIKEIVSSFKVAVQVGGGIRTVKTAFDLKAAGVDRVIVGTTAVENPAFAGKLCKELGSDSIVVGIDAKGGYVAVRGWTQQSGVAAVDMARQMSELGVKRIMYTDISRDGTLTEPNFDAIEELYQSVGLSLIAAGGVSSIAHLVRLAEIGIDSAVVGKAIYTGDVLLRDALRVVAKRANFDDQ